MPVSFKKFEKATDLEGILKRIRGRVEELKNLMPDLEKSSDQELKTAVMKDFQRMVSLLDRAGRGKLPDDFAEWEEKLDEIDVSLEASFRKLEERL